MHICVLHILTNNRQFEHIYKISFTASTLYTPLSFGPPPSFSLFIVATSRSENLHCKQKVVMYIYLYNLHMGCVGQIAKSGLGITPRDSKITILFGGGCPQIFLHTSALGTEAVCVLRPYLPDYLLYLCHCIFY